jgi:carbon monoxide dehydrogenase subunit G
MASICKEFLVEAAAEDVWAALRDFGAVHRRLAPGFVIDARLEGEARVITFANGAVARELLVSIDDKARRLAYTIVEGPLPYTHHNASFQVFTDGPGRTRFVWIADVLPHDLAETLEQRMEQGAAVMRKTLEARADS